MRKVSCLFCFGVFFSLSTRLSSVPASCEDCFHDFDCLFQLWWLSWYIKKWNGHIFKVKNVRWCDELHLDPDSRSIKKTRYKGPPSTWHEYVFFLIRWQSYGSSPHTFKPHISMRLWCLHRDLIDIKSCAFAEQAFLVAVYTYATLTSYPLPVCILSK